MMEMEELHSDCPLRIRLFRAAGREGGAAMSSSRSSRSESSSVIFSDLLEMIEGDEGLQTTIRRFYSVWKANSTSARLSLV